MKFSHVSRRNLSNALLTLFVTLGACSDPTTIAGAGSGQSSEPTRPATPPGPSSVLNIEVGQAVNGTITSNDPGCSFVTVEGGWGGLCNAFVITVRTSGVLQITARWTADAPLVLFSKTSSGDQIDLACCSAPDLMRLPVDSGGTYRIELAYAGRPAGYPRIQPVAYTLETSLVPPDTVSTGALRAIVFDSYPQQWLGRARLEVIDGPAGGRTAAFDEATGLYELAGLPIGYVTVVVSADGFVPLTVRVPVGVSVSRELVLRRQTPLVDAKHRLIGVGWANAARTSAYVGVKIEILDGPMAGVFTFTDEFFGMYGFVGLPPGPIRLRASSAVVQPQTLSVDVSGDLTRLDFHLQPR